MDPHLRQILIDVEVNAALEASRRSFTETENDILRRLLLGGGTRRVAPASGDREPPGPREPGERSNGRWTVVLGERRVSAANLKGAYRTLLLLLAERDPAFLAQFSREAARSRRFVARTPTDLYLNSPELAKRYAKPLADGWFFDTNLSTDQVARRARIAARVSNLLYGRDVQLLNNLEQI